MLTPTAFAQCCGPFERHFAAGVSADAAVKSSRMPALPARRHCSSVVRIINPVSIFRDDVPKPITERSEQPRICRRLQILRDWSYDESQDIPEVLGRGA